MSSVDFDIIIKYFSGQATPEEALYIEEWKRASPENEQYFNELFRSWNESVPYTPPDPEAEWQRFRKAAGYTASEDGPSPESKKRSLGWLRYAAVLLLLLSTAVYFLVFDKEEPFIVTSNTAGQKFRLPDSTIAILEKGAEINYQADRKANRNLTLRGNGAFTVTDHYSQFHISLPCGLNIEDIGTEFHIYQDTDSVRITVRDGKVRAWNDAEHVYVIKNKVLHYIIKDRKFLLQDYTGDFNIQDKKLGEVCRIISAYFNTQVIVGDPEIEDLAISINSHEVSLRQIMDIISATFDIQYTESGNAFTFRKN